MVSEETLSGLSLFRGLEDVERELLARDALWTDYDSGQAIFQKGDKSTRFHVLVDGVVKLSRSTSEGKEHTLYLVEAGEPFCLCTIYGSESLPVTAVAMAPSRIVSFPGPLVEELARKTPQLLRNILRVLNDRLTSSMQMIEDLALRDIYQRTASFLLLTSRTQCSASPQITLSVPRQEVAKILGTTPETISRVLARMGQEGLITAKGRTIDILNLAALEVVAG